MVETGVTQRTCQTLREASCKCCVGFESKLQVSVSISNFKFQFERAFILSRG